MRYSVNKWIGTEGYSITVEIAPNDITWLSRERASELCPAFTAIIEHADKRMFSPTSGEVDQLEFARFMKVLLRRELTYLEAISKLPPKEQNAS